MQDAVVLRSQAFALREAQDTEAAFALIAQVAVLLPNDPLTAFAHAQMAFESGRPCLELFEKARAINPTNLQCLHNAAAALAGSGQLDQALALLSQQLDQQPDWLAGHALVSKFDQIHGRPLGETYQRAVQHLPHSRPLYLAWFQLLALAKDWKGAAHVLELAATQTGQSQGIKLAKLYLASESVVLETRSPSATDGLFDSVEPLIDPGLDLCRVRYFLKLKQLDRAERYASRHMSTSAAPLFWPYLSLIWRALADPRADWLDRGGSFIQTVDLAIADADMADLATVLRTLHAARAPYLEQSVRGGTQTDGQLLFHHHPQIQAIRRRIKEAVRAYCDALPPPEQGHPLLDSARADVRYAGSWSVLLGRNGYHTNHTHPQGWISSALYVDLPSTEALGPPPAGWLDLGTPPSELDTDLSGYQRVEPKIGRLVLFPSTLWHGTLPFHDGERLSVAFDVSRPTSPVN